MKIYVKRPKKEQKKTTLESNDFKLIWNRKFNSKRMATVASVYEINRFIRTPKDIYDEFFNNVQKRETNKRPSPKAKRVWAGLENSGEYQIHGMFEETLKHSDSDKKEWVVLVNGDLNQIKIIKKFARKFLAVTDLGELHGIHQVRMKSVSFVTNCHGSGAD
jgi:poly-beta-hydroxyalkanoate depolymerase